VNSIRIPELGHPAQADAGQLPAIGTIANGIDMRWIPGPFLVDLSQIIQIPKGELARVVPRNDAPHAVGVEDG
jgi:hypothetical protein